MFETKSQNPQPLASVVLSTLTISFSSFLGSAAGQTARPEQDPGSIVEREERETQRLLNGLLSNGKLGVPTGTEFVSLSNIDRPIILVLGVRTTPTDTQKEAEELAKLTSRAVIPLANYASKQQIEKFLQSLDEELFSLLGVADDSSVQEIAKALNKGAADVTGALCDGFNAVFDRFAPAELSLEPATRSLADEIVRRISTDETLEIVAHSQGTVICRNAFRLAVDELHAKRKELGLSPEELSRRLSAAKVVAAGSFVGPAEWGIPAKLVVVNSKDDPISSIAGWNDWFQKEGQDFRFVSHSFSDRYRAEIAPLLK
ncbi:MAG: hypothetical protein KDD64_15075 [Bdellovibrionales bacterium]|nr:hypothetical protein [Bdellovibrionales bacterium]